MNAQIRSHVNVEFGRLDLGGGGSKETFRRHVERVQKTKQVFIWFYMVFAWLIIVLYDFYIVLFDFIMFFYMIFIVFITSIIIITIISWRCGLIIQMSSFFWLLKFSRITNVWPDFQGLAGNSNVFFWKIRLPPIFSIVLFFANSNVFSGNSDYHLICQMSRFLNISFFPDY